MADLFTYGSTPQSSLGRLIALGFLIAASIVIRIPLLMEPWGGDQGGFGYVARGILDGKVPYKDIYDLTGYGVFFTFALFFLLFGLTMSAVHIGHIVVSVATILVVYSITRRVFGGTAAWIAAVSCSLFGNGLAFSGFGYENKNAWGTYWYLAQREVFMAPLFAGAVFIMILLPTIRRRWRTAALLAAGSLVGIAAIYKLTAILMLAALFLFVSFDEWHRGRSKQAAKKILWQCSMLLLGFVAVQLPFLYYFWAHGALRELYEALFLHVAVYAKLSRGMRIETFFSGHYSVARENLILWLFASISSLDIAFNNRKRDALLIVLWAVACLMMVWGQGKYFGYHFIVLLPPFCVLAGYGLLRFVDFGGGIRRIISRNFGDIRKSFIAVMTASSLVSFGILNYDYYRWHALYLLGRISKSEYYEVFNEFPTHPYSFRSDYQVAGYLKDHLKRGERLGVLFCSGDTVIHFLLGIEDVTRFLQTWHLFSSDPALADNNLTRRLRAEFVDQITDAWPKYILLVHMPLDELLSIPVVKDDPATIRLGAFIKGNYAVSKVFPDNRFLFERRCK